MSAPGGSNVQYLRIGKSIGGMSSVRCIKFVRFSEGPLLEVLLYIFESGSYFGPAFPLCVYICSFLKKERRESVSK